MDIKHIILDKQQNQTDIQLHTRTSINHIQSKPINDLFTQINNHLLQLKPQSNNIYIFTPKHKISTLTINVIMTLPTICILNAINFFVRFSIDILSHNVI